MRKLLVAACAVSLLGGCAPMVTQYQKVGHRHGYVKAKPVAVPAAPPPVIVAPPAPPPAPEKPKGFFERHPIKWLH